MYNAITRRDKDPTEEFANLWLNTKTGSAWIWDDKPVLIGMTKEGKTLSLDIFEAEFVFTPRRNEQKYFYDIDYDKIPILIIAEVEGEGEIISIGDYGEVEATEGKYIISQKGNFKLGSDLKLTCEPKKLVKIKLYIISYE